MHDLYGNDTDNNDIDIDNNNMDYNDQCNDTQNQEKQSMLTSK